MTDEIAARYSSIPHQELVEANRSRKQPTVALLGHGSTMEYYFTQMALQKLNIRTLLLAENNSPEAMRTLLERCGVLALILEFGLSLEIDNLRQVSMLEGCLQHTASTHEEQRILCFDDGQDAWERQAFMIHSSGSTGPQKPIVRTDRSILTISRMYRLFPDFHIENWFLLFPL